MLGVIGCSSVATNVDKTSAADRSEGEITPMTGMVSSENAVDALSIRGPSHVADAPEVDPPENPVNPKLPTSVTDINGKTVKITTADRVLALDLYSTLADTIIGLGLSGRLVGRAASDTQVVLSPLPVVSREGLDLNVEAVLGLQPDLILTNLTIGNERTYAQLESAGITVVRFAEVPSIEDIPQSIRDVADVFGLGDESEILSQQFSEELKAVRDHIEQLMAATPRAPRAIVLYVRGSGGVFFIFGPGYGAAQILQELGLDDVASDSGIGDLAPANAEALVSLDPEVMLAMRDGVESTGGIDGLMARPGVAETTAGRNKRLVVAADSQLLSYGLRTPSNLEALATALYTDGIDD